MKICKGHVGQHVHGDGDGQGVPRGPGKRSLGSVVRQMDSLCFVCPASTRKNTVHRIVAEGTLASQHDCVQCFRIGTADGCIFDGQHALTVFLHLYLASRADRQLAIRSVDRALCSSGLVYLSPAVKHWPWSSPRLVSRIIESGNCSDECPVCRCGTLASTWSASCSG